MKKLILFITVVALLVSFAGCSHSSGQTDDAVTGKWGITLEAENASPTGMTLVCHQSGGEGVFELNTGSFYSIQKFEDSGWVDITEETQVWTTEAWLIQKDGTTKWDLNWENYWGALPAGEYRIAKPISNFRGPGDYDTETFYAEFTIR